MIVWVLVAVFINESHNGNHYYDAARSAIVIDNIATAESCDKLARVIRQSRDVAVTCAPVRKVKL